MPPCENGNPVAAVGVKTDLTAALVFLAPALTEMPVIPT